jgi:SAM-dependent methyltransferase
LHKLDWDYTQLADAYVKRPDYSGAAIDLALAHAGIAAGALAADMGAGAGHLTRELAERGLRVTAVEPNASMRRHGMARTRAHADVRWIDAVMQSSGLPDKHFALVSYGSSFGVTDRAETLREAARLLADAGWFMCVFNHRDLQDPLQARIEHYIHARIPDYAYGTRREDQLEVIRACGRFGPVEKIERPIMHVCPARDWVAAWASHATLQRQAGARFGAILEGIADIVAGAGGDTLHVPYTTRVWLARLAD